MFRSMPSLVIQKATVFNASWIFLSKLNEIVGAAMSVVKTNFQNIYFIIIYFRYLFHYLKFVKNLFLLFLFFFFSVS